MPRTRSQPQARPRPSPPEGEPGKRRAILHAALRVFAEKGYHGCRIADVARQAGVAYGLVDHYFRNKDELLESVFEEQWAILIGAIRAIADGPGSAAEQIASVIRFALDVFRTAPAAVRVLILEVPRTLCPRSNRSIVKAGPARADAVGRATRDAQAAGTSRSRVISEGAPSRFGGPQ